ncbi:MAG: hypothetical protein ACO4AU_02180 [bacterium]|jgi:hypothetical protein
MRSTLLLFLLLAVSGSCLQAAEPWRLRFLVPQSESGTLALDEEDPVKASRATGKSGVLVFGNGFGVGITNVRTEGTVSGSSGYVSSDSIDLSYTIGGRLSLTLAVGGVTAGESQIRISGTDYVTATAVGSTGMILVGLPFLGGELLAGARGDSVEFKNYRTAGSPDPIDTVVTASTRQLMLGFGLVF